MTVNPRVQFSLFSELKGAAAYNGLEQENRTNSMSEEANSYKTPSRFSSGLFKPHQNQSRTRPATPNAAAAQNDAPKIRLASHENQLTPGLRNRIARTQEQIKKHGDDHQRTCNNEQGPRWGAEQGRYLR